MSTTSEETTKCEERRCETCKHFSETPAYDTCRYNPPVMIGPSRVGCWPTVLLTDYCSKWEE